jgi:hypothetical protein
MEDTSAVREHWIVVETTEDHSQNEFGPFNTFESAVKFANVATFPWSGDFLSKITVMKVKLKPFSSTILGSKKGE